MADVKINLNLDEVDERRFPPYVFSVGDRTFTFTDPSVLDWRTVEGLTTLDALAELCMTPDDRKAFYSTPLASYKLGILFEDVQRHFELGQYATKRR